MRVIAVDVGSAVGYLDLDITGFLAGLRSAQDEAALASKNLATKLGGNLTGFGKSMTAVGTTLTKNVSVPLAGIGVIGLKTAMDFEKGMSGVKAISGATGEELTALRDTAIDLGATTSFSAIEVVGAMTEMAKAGWNSQQIIDGMGGVLDATAASGESLSTVSTIVADAITSFGLEAKDSTKVADVLTQAANSGTIGIYDLGESFKYIAPVANAMGFRIEDVTTALTVMSKSGIKGSQAGTSLRTTLVNLADPTDEVAIAMDELGISITNQDGSFKSLNEIVGEMRGAFSGLTDEQKVYYASVFAGKEGMSGLLALLGLTQEEYDEVAESMENASGVAKDTAAIMQDNLSSKIEQLGGSLESLAIKLADFVIPYLQKFVEWLTGLVDKFTALDPETQKMILKFAGLAIAIGPIISILGKLVSGTGSLFTAFGKLSGGFKAVAAGGKAGTGMLSKLGGAFAGVTGPVIAVIAIIAILTAAFINLWKNNEEFRDKITEIWNQIKETFSNLVQGIVDRLNSLGFKFTSITDVLKAVWEGFCNFLAPIFEGVFQYIADTFDVIVNQVLAILDIFIALFKGDWEGVWEGIKTYFLNIWNYIIDWFQNIGNTLVGILDTICGWFGTTWSDTWNSIKTFFINIWNSISTWFQATLTSIKNFFTNIWNGIASFLSTTWETIKSTFSNALTIIKTNVATAWDSIKTTIANVWNGIKTAISTALDTIKTTISNIWNSIKTTASTVWNSIKIAITNVWNGIKTSVSNAVDSVKTAVSNAFNSIKTTASNVWNGIKTAISDAVNGVKTTVSNTFNSIKTTASSIWDGIKTAISTAIDTARSTVSGVVDGIKSKISSGFNAAKSTVSSIFDSIKTAISNTMTSARDTVKGVIDKIKSFFNFEWSLPKLKMPHLKISGKFSLSPPSVPKFSVDWYKKAMNNGMFLDSATIFGFNPKTGKFLGGGEAGSETIVGTKSLLSMIKQAVHDAVDPLILISRELARASAELGYVTYNGFTKLKEYKESQQDNSNRDNGSGDTFIFNSPKPIDEIEAAKQFKRTKRELAEGF